MSRRIWCAVSGHGFGHLSQVAPLLRVLRARLPDLHVHVVSALPQAVLARLLDMACSSETRALDVGLVQPDPMQVDKEATAAGLRALYGAWSRHLEKEKRAMAAWKPDLILSNVPCLPLAAGADLGIPTVAIASLTWDAVLAAYFPLDDPEVFGWWHAMRRVYAGSTLALLPAPSIVEGHPFSQVEHIHPLTTRGHRRRVMLRQQLGIAASDDRPLILVSLGGIPAQEIPVEALIQEKRFHWLLDVPFSASPGHLHRMHLLLNSWRYPDLSASVDGMVSKPGYGMAVAAGVQQIPFLYLRRGAFPDEPPICRWLDRVGRCQELSPRMFYSGAWYDPMQALLSRLPKPAVPGNGAEQGAAIIIQRFFSS